MYSGMTIDGLQAQLDATNAERDSLSVKAKEIAREIEARRVQEEVAQMPEAQRDALRQALYPQSVPSGEQFGKV